MRKTQFDHFLKGLKFSLLWYFAWCLIKVITLIRKFAEKLTLPPLGNRAPIPSSFPCQGLSAFWSVSLSCTHKKYKLFWCFWKGGEKKKPSHSCGLWMLITATFRCAKEGSMAGGSWERPSRPRLGAHWGSSGTAQHTQICASKGSAVFYQNITSLKPRSRPVAHGMQGLSYKISSALLQKFTHRGFL